MQQERVIAACLKRRPPRRLFVLLCSSSTPLAKEFRPLSSETKPALFLLVLKACHRKIPCHLLELRSWDRAQKTLLTHHLRVMSSCKTSTEPPEHTIISGDVTPKSGDSKGGWFDCLF